MSCAGCGQVENAGRPWPWSLIAEPGSCWAGRRSGGRGGRRITSGSIKCTQISLNDRGAASRRLPKGLRAPLDHSRLPDTITSAYSLSDALSCGRWYWNHTSWKASTLRSCLCESMPPSLQSVCSVCSTEVLDGLREALEVDHGPEFRGEAFTGLPERQG